MPGSRGKALESANPKDNSCTHREPEWLGSNAKVLRPMGLKEASEREQNAWLQNMPFWYADYFEVKAIKAQQTQEKLIPLPYLPKTI